MSTRDVRIELESDILDSLDNVTKATSALREFQLNEAYDDGFEAGVLASENGLARE